MPEASPILSAALGYLARGWPVFPVRPRSKIPLTPHGFRDASLSDGVVRGWWKRWPDANVGIPTGPASFDAVDLDGAQGIQTWVALEEQHGAAPAGPRQRTGGGGLHVCFRGVQA